MRQENLSREREIIQIPRTHKIPHTRIGYFGLFFFGKKMKGREDFDFLQGGEGTQDSPPIKIKIHS